jgi:hypothetical protein
MANFKGDGAIEKLVSQNPDTPDVYFTVVWILAYYFRRSVERSAALGSPE